MTSRFVSGGTIATAEAGATTQASSTSAAQPSSTATAAAATTAPSSKSSAPASAAWERAQAQLASERAARDAARRAAVEGGSGTGQAPPSLYETLQANKAAKQAAFEEANRLRNQFRALDDDEADFLEGVAASERAEEARRRRELEDGLRGFRERQKDEAAAAAGGEQTRKGAGTAGGADAHARGVEDGDEEDGVAVEADPDAAVEWAAPAARKRKREKEHGIKGLKRRVSGADAKKEDEKPASEAAANGRSQKGTAPHTTDGKSSKAEDEQVKPPAAKIQKTSENAGTSQAKATPKGTMGLVDYGSDDDDDD
jgi:hypothetical protein